MSVYLTVCDNFVRSSQGRNLCWAACIEMLLKHEHVKKRGTAPLFNQYQIAALMGKGNEPASHEEVRRALVIVGFTPLEIPANSGSVKHSLKKGYPVILGLPPNQGNVGHAVLAVGYWTSPPYRIRVFDPSKPAYDPFHIWNQELLNPYNWALTAVPPFPGN